MTDTSTFINQGVQHAEKAIQYDKLACKSSNPELYENAKNSYVRAIEYYYTALKYEQNNHTQRTLRDKIEAYMSRAETMKEWLTKYQAQQKDAAENPQIDPNASEGGGTATPSKKKGEKEDDNADERLRKRLGTAVLTEKPNVKWDDVAGLEGAKEALREAVILPQLFPQMFTGKRRPWKGILLYGPPGTGKSYLAKAVATEADATFFSVSSSDLVSKWQGESEKLVRELFSMARQAGKAIIFIDEIDALVSSRNDNESESSRRIKTEFLVQMDGVGHSADNVLLLAATNIPWALDEAMLRRMERRIYIPLPDPRARATMFQLHLGSTPHDLEHDDFLQLADKSDGYSGSDIAILCRDAIMQPVRTLQNACFFKEITVEENGQNKKKLAPCSQGDPDAKEMNLMSIDAEKLLVPSVSRYDFDRALSSTKPSVGKENIAKHTKFTHEKGQSGV
ncbi:Vacuolar protein sorting-associated protein 4 [Gracilariopsis chorda]|uniref:Vacuolar protein sorting-associated protein 4 n=1 Tax=Gracilariopsis chorda TaxID=448386 RepID=A0A2V3IRI8_9FLOR|nr:Vacuolar protein sorting-associated protein 4 [Gracilariopsis chorda]|eukprot:PXF44736.1 Vacuolar protein sorting-associated protein 4 [Gracilariopsis chorda]